MRYPLTIEGMRAKLHEAKPISWYREGKEIHAHDRMTRGYTYKLTAPYGKHFDERFNPELSPHDMLIMGVFEGKYLNDCMDEFPREWYRDALQRGSLSPEGPDPSVNEMGVKSRLSLREWRKNGWIPVAHGDRDVRGWFQWYCRYYIGRREKAVDDVQISRWNSFRRHAGQILADPRGKGLSKAEKRGHRAKQRQALLQWAYYPYI